MAACLAAGGRDFGAWELVSDGDLSMSEDKGSPWPRVSDDYRMNDTGVAKVSVQVSLNASK